MNKGKKLFEFQKYTIIMCIAGVLLIVWSQLPGGYAVFTDIFMGLGTGILGGCILFLITGKKSRELYEREEKQLLLHEMEDYVEKLYDIQYAISSDAAVRAEQYHSRYGETVYRIERMVRGTSVNVTRLALDERRRVCVEEMTNRDDVIWHGGSLDIMTWHEELLKKVEELNSSGGISDETEAEKYYQFVSSYKTKVIELRKAFKQYRDMTDYEKARIAKSII